jgi:hypothetical protein
MPSPAVAARLGGGGRRLSPPRTVRDCDRPNAYPLVDSRYSQCRKQHAPSSGHGNGHSGPRLAGQLTRTLQFPPHSPRVPLGLVLFGAADDLIALRELAAWLER